MVQDTTVAPREATALTSHDAEQAALAWLASEFPEWTFEVGSTDTYTRRGDQHWVARKPGHHPQAALSAAKLHTRLDEYLAREARRVAQAN